MHRVVVVMLLISGCAFGIDGPDPERPHSQIPRCDSGKGLVVLDGVMAATTGVVALSLVDTEEPAVALIPAALGALYIAGAVTGNRAANRCREAMTDFESYQASRDMMPGLDEDTGLARGRPPVGPGVPVHVPTAPASVATAPASPAPAPAPATPATAVPPPGPSGPAVTSPPSAPARAPAEPADDDWSAFWREVE